MVYWLGINDNNMEDKAISTAQDRSHTLWREQILPGVTLTCIHTDKFKTGCLTVNMLGALTRETASISALLPRVLRRGSSELPDMQSISAALDELYGTRIDPLVRKKGEMQCVGLYADFPDDRYIPGAENILEKAAGILGQMLTSPDMRDGLLRTDYVESEKVNLIDDIRAAINDKSGYAVDRLLDEMCAGEAYGVNRLGTEDTACAITPQTLTDHYLTLLETAAIEVFYCGSADPNRVLEAVKSALSSLKPREGPAVPKTEVVLTPAQETPRRVIEKLDVFQGKLTIGFRLGDTMLNPCYPALVVFNTLYGGSVTSKLFLNVREKLSLCYYASSMLDKHKGIMLVASGVEFEKFETALEEIMHQLELVKKGEVSQSELTSAKRVVITSIKSAMDRLGGLEELYFDSFVAAVPYDPTELCHAVEDITLAQVLSVASGIKPDMVYFLTGEGGKEHDS